MNEERIYRRRFDMSMRERGKENHDRLTMNTKFERQRSQRAQLAPQSATILALLLLLLLLGFSSCSSCSSC